MQKCHINESESRSLQNRFGSYSWDSFGIIRVRWGQTEEAAVAQQFYLQLAYCLSHMVIHYEYIIYILIAAAKVHLHREFLTKDKEFLRFKAKSGGGISFIFSLSLLLKLFSVGIRFAAQSTLGRIGSTADAARLQMLHQQLLQVRSQGALLVNLQLDLRHILLHLLDGRPELSQRRRHIFVLEA